MTLLSRILDAPSYGFSRDGALYVPTHGEIVREFLRRVNVLSSRHNWLPFFSWAATLVLIVPLYFFVTRYFSWPLAFLGFVYSMVILGSHGTFWLHRYGTHRAFRFTSPWARTICRNLTLRIIPEEIYIVSHHVHHQLSEKPGDPYNVHGGWLYCFLADVNHQTLNKSLNEKDYAQVRKLMEATGVRLNSYEQYRKWGSLCHPFFATAHYLANWAAWYGIFYLVGGHALATAFFGSAAVWGIGVRTFNYEGHGRGKDRRVEGIDFNRDDLSVNQIWPGYVSGEWHNNHHLYPSGARAGFLPYQLDLVWHFIRLLEVLGAVSGVRDPKADFMKRYYLPYLESKKAVAQPVPAPAPALDPVP